MQIDANIAAYFSDVLRNKYGNNLSEQEIADRIEAVSDKFTKFLLNEFKTQVAMNSEQELEFRSLYNNSQDALQFLEQIVKMNTSQNLDSVLIEILNNFVSQYYELF
jgi:hypothetical protein